MQRVAALEHRRAGELGVGDLVIAEAAFLEQLVARPNPIAVVPPFLAAENQVRAGNLADAGRLTAVSEVQRNRHRLRRDQAAEFRFARKSLIPVDRTGIVHRHYPATAIARRARVTELTHTYKLPDDMSQDQTD